MFEKKIPGVIAAYPDGATRTVEVLTYKAKGLTEKRIKSVLKNRKDLKLVSLECTSAKAEGDDDASNN